MSTFIDQSDVDQYGYLKSNIKSTDVVIFTVGTAIKKVGRRCEFECVPDTIKMLHEIRQQIHDLNKNTAVFFTLSPVTLQGIAWDSTSGLTAVEADCISKSISRVAIYSFMKEIEGDIASKTFYYPSYELVRWIMD